jgi:AcrR family transcriptional regulator
MRAKAARTRARILDAAAHELSTQGFAGTRLIDVAERAGLQAPAIYYYFDSSEDLVEEVMWTGIAEMHEHVRDLLAALPDDVDPLGRIEHAVEAHLRHELELSDYTTAAIRNAGQVPDHLLVRYNTEAAAYGRLWRRLLEEARAADLLRDDLDLRAARMLVLGALNWAAEWWDPTRGRLDPVVATAQSIVRHGISRPG